MPDDVLASAIEQAERAKAPVRAAAFLRISRVETATNPGIARNTFDRGVDAVRRISGIEGEFLLEQAALIAAAVAPELLTGSEELVPPHLFEHTVIEVMLDHGHLKQAVAYLTGSKDTPEFPFGMAQTVMWRLSEPSLKLSLLRHAVEAWRRSPPYDPMKPPDDGFIHLFQREWGVLPETEALTLAREIVQVTAEQPERPMTASYADVEVTSWRAHVFFQILHVLLRIDPERADLLIAKSPQLARAARRFPRGLESMEEEAESRRRQQPPSEKGGQIMMGSPEDFPYLKALQQSSVDGDFRPVFEFAIKKYRQDSNRRSPNLAPFELWPSASTYRHILYQAGKRLGQDGASTYLERVPDDDLRLFAQIELAAALAGLPEMRGIQREYRVPAARTSRSARK